MALQEKLEGRRVALRAEQLRLKEEEKEIKFVQAQQAASAAQVEETKFRELRKGAERTVRVKQSAAKAEETLHEVRAAPRAQAPPSYIFCPPRRRRGPGAGAGGGGGRSGGAGLCP